MLKLLFKFKKKLEEKGFTLVELLAVIVILAIIMLIAIPAVLNSVDSARRKTFSEYVTKTAGLAQQKYAESLITETSFGGNCIIYDITTDLGTSNSGEYKGYVLLNTITNDIYVTLSDDSYGITAYHFNDSKKELVSNLSPIGSIEEDKLTKEYLCSNSNCNSCSYKEGGIDKGIIADKESNEDAKEKYAFMVTGQQLNISIRRLFNPNISVINQPFNDVKEFLYNDTLKDTEDKIDVSTPESKYRIWIWRIESRVYYYTDAPNGIYLNADSSHMFTNLMSLKTIDTSKWNSSKVENAFMMFGSCAVEELDLRHFDTKAMTNMGYMFSYAQQLKKLDISSFDTTNVTNMLGMFMGASSLETLDLSHFKTSKITTMKYMFYDCKALKNLNIRGFDTSKVTNFSMVFTGCKNLTSFDFSYLDTSSATTMEDLFDGCESLVEINLTNINTSNVTNMEAMFAYCTSLKIIDPSKLNTSNVTSMDGMFASCEALTSLNLSSFDTKNVTKMGQMFGSCKNLVTVDISSFDTSNVERMSWMFYGCENLKNIYVGTKWDISKVTDHFMVFTDCAKLPHFNKNEDELQHADYSSTGYLTKK